MNPVFHKNDKKSAQPLTNDTGETTGQSLAPPNFQLNAEPVQAKMEQEKAGEESLQLKTAEPIQKKAIATGAASGVVQMVSELTPRQLQLRQTFRVYQSTKAAQLAPGQVAAFNAKCEEFIEEMDSPGFWDWLTPSPRWGEDAYYEGLAEDFPDYEAILNGETTRLNSIAIEQAREAETMAQATVEKAQAAVQLAQTNLEAARTAAQQAEVQATAAETAATQAEASAATEGAGPEEVAAAQRAREAATAARTAATQAQSAVTQAEGNSEMAGHQLDHAEGQLEMAQEQIRSATLSTEVLASQQLVEATTSLQGGITSLSGGIETNTEASTGARTTAEASAETAGSQAVTARVEAINAQPIVGLQDRFDAIDNAAVADREAAAIALMEFVREQIALYPPRIQNFKRQATPDPTEKVRIIGEVVAAAARVEWLIGTIFLEGSETTDEWEDSNNNDDSNNVLAGYYQENTSASSGPWCTKFMGTIWKEVADLRDEGGNVPTGKLWSGYKVSRNDYFDYDTDQGGDHAGTGHLQGDQSAFIDLRNALEATEVQTERETIVDTFFTEHIQPQAGDTMVVRRSTASQNSFVDYKSHTTMVERLDGRTLYTIEGNTGDRVAGKSYDLTDPDVAQEIIFISRFSLNAMGPAEEEGADPYEGPTVSQGELLAPIQKLSGLLQTYAQTNGYIEELAEGAVNAVVNLQESTAGDDME